jgi:uncharacterized MAPEG superfamily protein
MSPGMDAALWGLVGLAVLVLLHIGAQGLALKRAAGNAWSVGPRDHPVTLAPVHGRLRRALDNLLESAPVFLSLALVAHLAGRVGALVEVGIALFLAGRLGYLPAYASGLPWLRTGFWHLASVGMVLMLVGVLWP